MGECFRYACGYMFKQSGGYCHLLPYDVYCFRIVYSAVQIVVIAGVCHVASQGCRDFECVADFTLLLAYAVAGEECKAVYFYGSCHGGLFASCACLAFCVVAFFLFGGFRCESLGYRDVFAEVVFSGAFEAFVYKHEVKLFAFKISAYYFHSDVVAEAVAHIFTASGKTIVFFVEVIEVVGKFSYWHESFAFVFVEFYI